MTLVLNDRTAIAGARLAAVRGALRLAALGMRGQHISAARAIATDAGYFEAARDAGMRKTDALRWVISALDHDQAIHHDYYDSLPSSDLDHQARWDEISPAGRRLLIAAGHPDPTDGRGHRRR